MNNPWIQTFTGKAFDLLDPKPDQVDFMDVAIALSRICRYTGHSSVPYYVAQHSVLVSHQVPEEDARWALLHDAHEAYVGDVSSPLKAAIGPAWYRLENAIQATVVSRFGLPLEQPSSVKEADMRMLATERRDLLEEGNREWTGLLEPYSDKIQPWGQEYAFMEFVRRYQELFD